LGEGVRAHRPLAPSPKTGNHMPPHWEIQLDRQERRRRVALVEGRARLAEGPQAGEELEFFLTFYTDQVSLNLPASTAGRQFITRLTEILGPPRLEPTIKCSCSWGEGVMGAMLIVLWDLYPQDAPSQTLQDLKTFLGNQLELPDHQGSAPRTAIPSQDL